MIYSEYHREIHKKLMQNKDPNKLWGSLFENAWVGFILFNHMNKDQITLNEILSFCERWIHSASITDLLKEERNIGALSLYAGIMSKIKGKESAKKIQNLINKKIIELDEKEKGKFSLFNSPEIFYSTVTGLVMSGMLEKVTREILFRHAFNEAKNRWYGKIYRFALYSAALFELKVDTAIIDTVVNFLSSISIKELSVDELIPLLWFIVKHDENILNRLRDTSLRKLIGDVKEKLWKQFESQYIYFSYEFQTTSEDTEIDSSTVYSLSTFELSMVDDFLAYQEKVYKTDPNMIFDLLQLHPVVKDASEKLFKDKHYAQAIFEAYKALINYVKEKSKKKNLDGQKLMTTVFNVKYDEENLNIKKKPILQLNELQTREDIDEQIGFMQLFMGAVMGIRNPPAHGLIKHEDPFKVLEYLSFASLLAKKVDEAKFNGDT